MFKEQTVIWELLSKQDDKAEPGKWEGNQMRTCKMVANNSSKEQSKIAELGAELGRRCLEIHHPEKQRREGLQKYTYV